MRKASSSSNDTEQSDKKVNPTTGSTVPQLPSLQERLEMGNANEVLTTVVFLKIPWDKSTDIAVLKEMQHFEGVAKYEKKEINKQIRVFVQFETHSHAQKVLEASMFGGHKVVIRWVDKWTKECPWNFDDVPEPPARRRSSVGTSAAASSTAKRPPVAPTAQSKVKAEPNAEDKERMEKFQKVMAHVSKKLKTIESVLDKAKDESLNTAFASVEKFCDLLDDGLMFSSKPSGEQKKARAERLAEFQKRFGVIQKHYEEFASDPVGYNRRHLKTKPTAKPAAKINTGTTPPQKTAPATVKSSSSSTTPSTTSTASKTSPSPSTTASATVKSDDSSSSTSAASKNESSSSISTSTASKSDSSSSSS